MTRITVPAGACRRTLAYLVSARGSLTTEQATDFVASLPQSSGPGNIAPARMRPSAGRWLAAQGRVLA